MTFFIFLTHAFQLTAILQYSHNVCPHQRSSVKNWLNEWVLSTCKCKGCSYLLVSLLFLSQPPILNFLVQVWCPFWEIKQIPPIHHVNSSSPHPFSNELVLFFQDPLVIQTAISVHFCLWYHNSQCHLSEFMLWSPNVFTYMSSILVLLSNFSHFTFLPPPTFTFLPQN